MILVVDTGNSNTEFACMNDSLEVLLSFRIPTAKEDTAYGYAARISAIFNLENIDAKGFEGIVISSVVPEVTRALKKALKLITGMDPLVLGEGIRTDLDICIEGGVIAPDLEAAAVAAKELYPLPCAIIDMGTATTITVVNKDGEYIGGVIYPGAGISLKALTQSASLLPGIAIEAPKKAIATETTDAMKSGLVYGEAGSIDGIIQYFEEELGETFASIVSTGGLGGLICPYCRHDITLDPELLLKGLGIIWGKNK